MKTIMRKIICMFAVWAFVLCPQAGAGIATSTAKITREAIEQGTRALLKQVGKAGAKEMEEAAAKKIVQQVAKNNPEVSRLVKEFGEDAVSHLIRKPAARQLISEAGEDAAMAVLKHGNLGVDLLSKSPKECLPGVARALSGMEKEATRRLSVRIGELGATSAAAAGAALKWVAAHPKLAATGVLGAWLIAHPETRAMLVWVMGHPILSIFLALLFVVAFKLFWKYGAPMLINKFRKRIASN